MSTPDLVAAFYHRIWNAGDLAAVADILAENFSFRNSLGGEMRGHEAFTSYVQSIRGAIENYQCEILECVVEQDQAFAKMRFGGIHRGQFRGYEPTGKPIHWMGAALFRIKDALIVDVWVLGDLAGLDELLKNNAKNA